MPLPQLDRFAVLMQPLPARENKKTIDTDHVSPDAPPGRLPGDGQQTIEEAVERIRAARENGRPVVVAFGAHAIKNGLGPVFLRLAERGWVTHLATNGAGVIHDWEFAYQGQSCEHVGPMVAEGRFGNWQDTGFSINLAINVGAYEGKGYGESVGAMIENEGLDIPSAAELEATVRDNLATDPLKSAAAADLLYVVRAFDLPARRMEIPHPWKRYSIQAGAFRLGVPFTSHPMIGHDIIYNHPMNHCASLGRAAQRDFLAYADAISRIDGGVYLSIGSAVMSPMVFEKSLSMAQNLAIQRGEHIDRHYILVERSGGSDVGLGSGRTSRGEPGVLPALQQNVQPDGGTMRYVQADNRDLLLNLTHMLGEHSP